MHFRGEERCSQGSVKRGEDRGWVPLLETSARWCVRCVHAGSPCYLLRTERTDPGQKAGSCTCREPVGLSWLLCLSFPLLWNIRAAEPGSCPHEHFSLSEKSRFDAFKLHSPSVMVGLKVSQGNDHEMLFHFHILCSLAVEFQCSDFFLFGCYIFALYDFFRQRY